MNGTQLKIRERINVTLPRETLMLIDDLTEKGNRSRFLNDAVHFYADQKRRGALRKNLREGAIARAERDKNLAQEWFLLENEAWQEK